MKRFFLPIIVLLFFTGCVSAQPRGEDHGDILTSETMSLENHFEMKNKWEALNIDTYSMEVSYNSFSFRKGIWVLTITKGILTGWETKNRKNHAADKDFASTLMQENLFKLAENAYLSPNSNIGYITTALYDRTGYITEIIFKKNSTKSNYTPTDRGYRIKILKLYY